MKKYIIPLSIVAATFAASCSSDENLPQEIDNSMKTPIEFSMTDQTGSATIGAESYRAQTRAGFSAQTRIVMRMMAEKITLGSSSEATASETKYTKTEAVAETNNGNRYSDVTFTNSESVINTRYWDDAYGRDTKLSVFAIAVPGKKSTDNIQLSLKGDNTWSTAHTDNTISWSVSNNQSSTTIGNEDLVYSNNIQKYNSQTGLGQNGVREWDFDSSKYKELTFDATGNPTGLSNDRMKFQMKPVSEGQPDPKGPGKFDTGNLNFTHALSRITLKIKLASEFGNNASLDDKEVKVLNMPYKGTLNVATGNFSSIENKDEIVMAPISTTEENIKGQYMAQVLPGYNIAADRTTNADNNMLQFKVVTKDASNNITSQNIYYVTNKSVNNALKDKENINGDKDSDGNITMAQGKHYILTITVGKTAIKDITATLVDWTNVEGTHEQNNAYLTFTTAFKNSYTGNTNAAADKFDLYRLNDPSTDVSTDGNYKSYDWKSKWTDKAELTKDNSSQETGKSKWTTKWYFDDNKSFYHFRMVGQKVDGESKISRTITKDETNGDYFDIESGTTDGNYTWGAPFVSKSDLIYSTTSGYDNESNGNHNIHYAIGATNDNIHLTSFHMLSKIRVVLKTVDASKGGVNLQSGEHKTTVKITNVFTKGKVNMGNGLVTAGTYFTGKDSRISVDMTAPSPFIKENTSNLETNEFTYFIVPQTLVEGQTYVGLEITTPDNNIYYVVKKLSEITALTVGSNGTQVPNEAIKWWYPNHSYLYTITLKKTGIEKITCTLVDWTEVTGNNQDVTIED